MGNFDIKFIPKIEIKGEVLADFTAEFIPPEVDGEILVDWILKTEKASNHRGVGVGFILESPEGFTHEKAIHLDFLASNNKAKYEALISRMLMAEELGY